MKEDTNKNLKKRRTFLKSLSATAVAGGIGVSQSANAQGQAAKGPVLSPKTPPDFPSENLSKYKANQEKDLHICRGLNTLRLDGKTSGKWNDGEGPGECEATSIPEKDLHGCMGGNTCAGLGGCGTGDYATQYWVAENLCGGAKPWEGGSGGCGVPLGSTNTGFICSQLNNAVPAPPKPTKKDSGAKEKGKDAETKGKETSDKHKKKPPEVSALIGVPVWAIARARFEYKMHQANKPFGNKDKTGKTIGCGEYEANSWDGTASFPPDDNKNPLNKLVQNPYPKPVPDRNPPTGS